MLLESHVPIQNFVFIVNPNLAKVENAGDVRACQKHLIFCLFEDLPENLNSV
jgi:hypothetical protein